jgi:hypothetical protein
MKMKVKSISYLFYVAIFIGMLSGNLTVNAQGGCSSAPPPRLLVGGRGYVTDEDITPLNVRTAPGTHGEIMTQMTAGDVFNVVDGPECGHQGNNLRWWVVRTPNGVTGWIAEGSVNPSLVYFVAPLNPGDTPPTYGSADRYPGDVPAVAGDFILGTAKVNVDGLRLRLQPSVNAEIKTVLSKGAELYVYVGPFYHRGYNWWYLSNNRISGWAVDEANNQPTLIFSWGTPRNVSTKGWANDDRPSTVTDAHVEAFHNIQRQVKQGEISEAEADRRMENIAAEVGAAGLKWLVRRVPVYDGKNKKWMSFDTYASDMADDYGDGTSRFEQDPVGTAVDMVFGDPSPSDMAGWLGFDFD